MLSHGITVDVSGYRINVNAVGPGMVLTELTQNMLGDPEQAEWFIERIPMRRIAEPQDIAPAVLFLASDEASYIHGTTLFVDGGMTSTPGHIELGGGNSETPILARAGPGLGHLERCAD